MNFHRKVIKTHENFRKMLSGASCGLLERVESDDADVVSVPVRDGLVGALHACLAVLLRLFEGLLVPESNGTRTIEFVRNVPSD